MYVEDKMSDRERRRRAEQSRRSFTIAEWCELRRISVAMYYKLRDQGLAPKTHNAGAKVLISPEADADWIRAREAESESQTAA
jgi:hypothetical protein